MNPAEVEFLAENQSIQIVPNFSHDRLYLICGEVWKIRFLSYLQFIATVSQNVVFLISKVGPFRPGIPVQVPLWLALNLKQRQKCRLTAPEWYSILCIFCHSTFA